MSMARARDGIADEQLAKINGERERGRKRSRDHDYDMTGSRKRTRSMSSYSSNSVSTISTNLSQDSRDLPNSDHDNYYTSQINEYAVPPPVPEPFHGQKRRRSFTESSSDSDASDRSRGFSLQRSSAEERVTRRKWKSRSPEQRGRRRSRSSNLADRDSRRSRSRSLSRGLRSRAKRRSPSPARAYGSRRTRRSPSPAWSDEREPASSKNHYKHGGAKSQQEATMGSPDEKMHTSDGRYRRKDSPGRNQRHRDRQDDNRSSNMRNSTKHVRQERSLSPYSKRLALTQAMNRGVA